MKNINLCQLQNQKGNIDMKAHIMSFKIQNENEHQRNQISSNVTGNGRLIIIIIIQKEYDTRKINTLHHATEI